MKIKNVPYSVILLSSFLKKKLEEGQVTAYVDK